MKEKIIIKKAKKGELNEIAEIFRIESAKKPYFQKRTPKKTLEKIKDAFGTQDLFAIELNKKIVGFITANIEEDHKDQVYVDELWITKEEQGKGIGKEVMKFIEEFYKKKGIRKIHLVSKKSSGAFVFYKKLNYKESEELIFLEKSLRK